MKRWILLFLLVPVFTLCIQGQDRNFKRIFLEAEYYILAAEYSSALKHYENLLSSDPENANLNFLTGFCLMKSGGDINHIIALFEKAVPNAHPSYKDGSYKERGAPLDVLFLLGRAYHINNQFDLAIETYTQYSTKIDKKDFAEVEYVNAHIKACELGESMINNPVDVEILPLEGQLESDGDVYNPVTSGNDSILIFVIYRNTRNYMMVSDRQGDSWSDPLVINPQIGLTGKFYPVSLSYDGTELYIAYNDDYNQDIYVSHFENGRWKRAVKLNDNINTRYTESHACISKDGQRLFFTSDRKGGIGGLDIYMAKRIDGDEWGEAINLGYSINTYYNEETPFLTNNDQRIYFSSQGHNTMGGYDIFISDISADSVSWNVPRNIGYPINTTDDNLFFNPGWDKGHAFYAMKSQDAGNFQQICKIRMPDPEVLYTASSPSQAGNGQQETDGGSSPTFSSMGIHYILNNILFEFNESRINEDAMRDAERIYILMRKFPEIDIELTGHTDARGDSEYNMRLSQERSQSVADFLISSGIDEQRISIKAAGESDPIAINQYEDGSDAPEGRRLNRHVSIKITNLSSDKIRVAEIFVPDDLIPEEDKGYTVLLFQSTGRVTATPEEFLGQQVSMISTDNSYMYTAGQFTQKSEAIEYLNEVIDEGYPDARIIERRSLEHLIQDNTIADPFAPLCYTVQFMALERQREASYFKNLPDVKRYKCKDGLYRYATGVFTNIEDALQLVPEIKKKGYRQALVLPCSKYLEMVVEE